MSQETNRYELAIKVGAEAIRQQKWEQALASYRSAQKGLPEDPRVLDGLGDAYAGMGNLDSARRAYEQAARLAPRETVYLDKIGGVRRGLGDPQQAALAYLMAGDLFWERGDLHEAEQRWRQTIELHPTYAGAHERLAILYKRQGDSEAMVKTYLLLADALMKQERRMAALHVCTTALALAPDDEQVRAKTDEVWRYAARREFRPSGRAAAAVQTGDLISAASDLAQWQLTATFRKNTIAPPNEERLEQNILLGQALLHEGQGQAGLAIDCYEKVVATGLQMPALFFGLGLLYRLVKRPDDAAAALTLAARDPFYALAVGLLGR